MTNSRIARIGTLASVPVIALWWWGTVAQTAPGNHKTITTEAEFHQAMKDLSNWGRWGQDDELGAANLITPAKRRRAAALVREGITVSLEHPIFQEEVVDGRGHLQRTFNLRPTGASDTYAFSSTYHGSIFSHLDSLNCHMLEDGKGYNGRSWEDAQKAGGCPTGDILALKDGIFTRAVLFDATLLPSKAPKGWLEPATAVHYDDLEALERIEKVKVSEGDIILLHTGRWKRRAELGPWKTSEGVAGYHADVAFFLKERGVSFIGADEWNDVSPTTLPQSVGLPIHKLALVALGVDIFDNLDLERVSETAKRLGRYEFLFTAAPLQVERGTGSPLNPIAVF
ncbi:MAG TPA: cyclase family protein [Vicinamibacterales bacterium]|nr:cyclase family protein [Vicinamibacterales bacterium]